MNFSMFRSGIAAAVYRPEFPPAHAFRDDEFPDDKAARAS
jgi:hypothetical protein